MRYKFQLKKILNYLTHNNQWSEPKTDNDERANRN